MATAPEVNYSKSNISLKTPPKQGENVNLFLRPGDELNLGVDLSKAQLQIVGGDVVATLPNGGQITFVSMGMMAFENNAPVIKLPNGSKMDVGQILNTIQDIAQAPKDAILVSGPVKIPDEKDPTKSKAQEAPVNDYNAYYVDPQPNVKPQDDVGAKDNSAKYLTEAVTEFTSNEKSSNDLTKKYSSTENNTKAKDNVADVSAALSFDIGFYQITASEDATSIAPSLKVLGGTGSTLGNVSKSASAQFQPETLDYRSNGSKQVITVDNPDLVNETYLTKLIRLNISQPVGFAITDITIAGLSNAFQILNSDFSSANSTGGGWSLSAGIGFTSVKTDSGEIIEFYIRYQPNSADMTLNFDYLMKVNLTSVFDMLNVPLAAQATVVVPELDTLTTYKDVGVIVKTVNSEADYTYTSSNYYQTGFVLDTTPNENIVYTGQQDSTVYGGLSNDTIYGNIGNDTLGGGKGNDTLSGGAGSNIINGEDGIDTVSYEFMTKYSDDFLFAVGSAIDPATGAAYANDTKGIVVDLQAGSATGKTVYDATADVLTGEETRNISDTLSNIEYVVGSKYDDTLRGDASNNKLVGGEGNDTLEGRGGSDWLDGGAGNDWLIGSTDDYMIDGGDNTDTIDFANNSMGVEVTLKNSSNGEIKNIGAATALTKIKNVENVAGSQFKDIIVGDDSNNLLIGGYDHSAVAVTAGDDTISGGAGADTIVGDMMVDSVIAGSMYAGSDLLKGDNDNDIIYGDSAPILSTSVLSVSADQSVEYIIDNGTTTLSTVYGGNDTIQGGAGDDYINGGSGWDTVDFSSSSAKVTAALGLIGGDGTATGEGSDRLVNIENIVGSTYGDTLAGNELTNTINGGSASDWVDYGYAGSSVNVNLSVGTAVVAGADTDTLISIENVLGSSHDDTITGANGANTLKGLNGNDTFYMYSDGDVVYGGNGVDTADYSNATAKVTANLTSGIGTVLGGSSTDTLAEIENIVGGSGNDSLVGDGESNILKGRSGDDTLNGMSGADTLIGGAGNDTFIGGAGNDVLWGGDDATHDSGVDTADYSASAGITLASGIVNDGLGGIDTLAGIEVVIGSGSADIMTGSSAADTLIGAGGDDTFYASGGGDTYYGGTSSIDSSDGDSVSYVGLSATVNHVVVDLSNTGGNNATLADSGGATVSIDSLRGIEIVTGTNGADTLIGKSSTKNTLIGGNGDDTLRGNFDGDFLSGGSGTGDTADYSNYDASAGNITVDLAATSSISIVGGAAADTLSQIEIVKTGGGNDTFKGSSSADIFYGNDGDDIFVGNGGNDTFYGGNGVNTADYSAALFGIDADLTRGSGQVIGNAATEGTDTLSNIQIIKGSLANDTIVGDGLNNTFYGNAGNDILRGNGGADHLDGGADNDTIYGGLDGDAIFGGTGTNTVSYTHLSTDNTVDLSQNEAYANSTSAVIDGLNNIQNVLMGSGDDTLIGTLSGNSLDGGGGNDLLAYGNQLVALTVDMGAQSIYKTSATASKDYFSAIERITTGSGADLFTVNTANDTASFTLDGGTGTDIIDYGAISESINVTLTGATGATVTVGSGTYNDIVANIENVKGSKADDTIIGDDSSSIVNVLNGNEGNDYIDGRNGNDTLYGDTGNDQLLGGLGNDKLYGGADNDTLSGGAGTDVLYGEAGDDIINADIDGVNDTYDGGLGADTVDYSAATLALSVALNGSTNATLTGGGVGNDVLVGIEKIIAGSGADNISALDNTSYTIIGMNGVDTLSGGAGADIIYGGNMSQTDNAVNTIKGGGGNDTIYAGSQGDSLQGGADNDVIYGGSGNDTLQGGLGDDTLDGGSNGAAGDWVDYSDAASFVRVDLRATTAQNTYGSGTDKLQNIENIIGSGVNDTLIGSSIGNNSILGGEGNDTIVGIAGANQLYGNDGSDVFFGGSGNDTFYGGTDAGVDTADYSNVASSLTVNIASGTVSYAGGGTDTLNSIENIIGSNNNDVMIGSAQDGITLQAAGGADSITGGSGAEIIYGDWDTVAGLRRISPAGSTTIVHAAGDDTIDGGGGSDTIYAGDGNDTLTGGTGIDTIYGEAGNDRFNLTISNSYTDIVDTIDGGIGANTLYFDTAGYTNYNTNTVLTVDLLNKKMSLVDNVANTTISSTNSIFNIQTIYGTGAVDSLTGDGGDNLFYGGTGADYLVGDSGSDTLYGGDDNDYIGGGVGTDILYGENGADILYGGADSDQLYGGSGDDTLYGESGNDIFDGGDGSDTYYGGAGTDAFQDTGASGIDIVSYSDSNYGIKAVVVGGQTVVTDGSVNGTYSSPTVTANVAGNANVGNDTIVSGVEKIVGSNLADFFFSYFGDNGVPTYSVTIDGGGGNDTVYGGSSNDSITGGANDDVIRGYDGNDTLDGGTGWDVVDYGYIADSDSNTLTGGVNVDLQGGTASVGGVAEDTLSNFDVIKGSANNDTLRGVNGARDDLYGGAGNDTFIATSGNDYYYGESGSDWISFVNASSGAVVDLTNVTTTQATISGALAQPVLNSIENIIGSDYADNLKGNTSVNTILAGNGADTVFVYDTSGGDYYDGGSDSSIDTISYYYNGGAVKVDLGNHVATLLSTSHTDAIWNFENISGTDSADTLIGDSGINTIYGNNGADQIYGSSTTDTNDLNDTIYAGYGNDTIYVSDSNDYIDGQNDVDTVNYNNTAILGTNIGIYVDLANTSSSNTTLLSSASYTNGTETITMAGAKDRLVNVEGIVGTNYADVLLGGTSNWYTLNGGDGDDIIYAGSGGSNNSIIGGSGNDWLTFNYNSTHKATSAVSVNLSSAALQTVWGGNAYKISGMENVKGSDYNDAITGDGNVNTLLGGAGNDSLDGGAGNDYLDGGSGSNNLVGGAGNDTLDGTNGVDTADYSYTGSSVNIILVDGTTGSATVSSGADTDVLKYIENATGGSGNDTITGSALDNIISGNDGLDTLSGGNGNDTLSGGIGSDILYGEVGNDLLYGGADMDTLYGGDGNDVVDGGDSNDTIVATSASDGIDTYTGSTGIDTLDYSALGSSNGINLIMSSSNSTVTVTGGNNDVITDVFEVIKATSGVDVISYNGSTGIVLYGNAGDDQLTGGSGSDSLYGGNDNDILTGGAGADYLSGDGGDDIYKYTSTADIASDVIFDSAGTDTILMGSDETYNLTTASLTNIEAIQFNTSVASKIAILTGTQAENLTSFVGSSGTDTVNINIESSNTSVDMSSKIVTNIDKFNITIGATSGNTTVYGTSTVDSIVGGNANDTIMGGGGNDTLIGGNGTNLFIVTAGSDMGSAEVVSGGTGTDTLQFTYSGANLTDSLWTNKTAIDVLDIQNDASVDLNGTNGRTFVQASDSDIVEIRDSNGGNANILLNSGGLSGGTTGKVVIGDIGTVTLSDTGNYVTLKDGVTGHSIIGGAGNDTIYGSNQNDRITAGSGSDYISTGSGSDNVFIASTELGAGDTIIGGSGGSDVLTLNFTDNGTITQNGATLSNIDIVQLANGGNTATLDLNGSTIQGGSGADIFQYSVANYGSSDYLYGGGGNDTLLFTDAGTINGASFTSSFKDSIEVIQLANGTNTVTAYAYSSGALYGGNDSDNVTVTSANTSGLIDLKDGSDTYNISAARNISDTGSSGTDILTLQSNSINISSNTISGIETLALGTITGTTISATQASGFTSITGSSGGSLTISGSLGSALNITSYNGNATISDASGKNVTLGSGTDKITDNTTTANAINGGSGNDTLYVTSGIDISAKTLTSIEEINLGATTGVTIGVVQATSVTNIIGSGSMTVSGSLTGALNLSSTGKNYTGAATISDANGQNVTLGNGANKITDNTTTANAINGGSGNDTLYVTSGIDISAKTLTSIEEINIGATAGVTMSSAQAVISGRSIVGSSGGSLTVSGSLGSNLSMSSYDGNATIANANGKNVTLGNGADTITNNVAGGTLNAGGGNDTYNISAATTINDSAGASDAVHITGAITQNATNITGIETIYIDANTSLTGSISASSVVVANGVTLTADASVVSTESISGNGTVNITNLQNTLLADLTHMTATTVNATWSSGTGTYGGDLTNVDNLTISSGTMTIADSKLSTTSVTGAGSLTVNADDASMDLSHVNISGTLTVNDGSGAQSLVGSANADIFNLDNTSATSDGSGGNDTYNVYAATNISDSSGTDTLNIQADGINLSAKTISGIDTIALGTHTGTTLSESEARGSSITGSAGGSLTVSGSLADSLNISGYSGNVTVDDANGNNVTLGSGNDTISTTTGGSVNMGSGNDHLTLDFSNLASLTMDGGAGTSDTLSVTGLNGQNVDLGSVNGVSNVEIFDISSLNLSSDSLTIDFNALWKIAQTSDLATNTFKLDLSGSDASGLTISGVDSATGTNASVDSGSHNLSFTTVSGTYDITYGSDTIHMMVV